MRILVALLLATCGGTPPKQPRDQLGPVLGQSTAPGPADPSRPTVDAPGVPPVDQPLPAKPSLPALPDDTGEIPHDAGAAEMH